MTSANPLNLYVGRRDYRNRTLDEILGWTDAQLESTHDYIQVLFPLTSPSRAVPQSPVMSYAFVVEVNTTEAVLNQVQEGLLRSLNRMLRFYGLELDESSSSTVQLDGSVSCPFLMEIEGYQALDRNGRVIDWRRNGNHNAQRISRILECLKYFGMHLYAIAFSEYLSQALPNHGSRRFWGY